MVMMSGTKIQNILRLMYKSTTPASSRKSIKIQSTENQQPPQKDNQSKMRMLSMILSRLFGCRVTDAFERIKVIPHRRLTIQLRMKGLVQNLFKRQDCHSKWASFQNIKRRAIDVEHRQVQYMGNTLKKQRATMIRLLTAFMLGKKRRILHMMLKRVKEYGNWRELYWNTNNRKALRTCTRIVKSRLQTTFNKIRDTRVTIDYCKKLKVMFSIVRQIYTQNRRWAFMNMRREMLRNKQEKASQEIKELDEKLQEGDDEEVKFLKEKYEELEKQFEDVKKEKEDMTAQFEAEVKEADTRNKEMKEHLEDLKQRQKQMKERIVQLNEQIKVPYSLEEIYELCYQNFLWTVSQNTDKTFSKQTLLASLSTPIVPIDLPIDKLQEESQVLRDLISEYILLYGQKKIPEGTKLEIPYEYLLKQNNALYRMLITLLPNAQFMKQELMKVRENFEDVGNSLKQLNLK